MNTPSFNDPSAELDERDRLRTSIVYPRRLVGELERIHGRTGTMQTTVNILLAKLQQQLTKNGLSIYDPDAFESAVSTCRIVFAGTAGGRKRSTSALPPSGVQSAVPDEATGGND